MPVDPIGAVGLGPELQIPALEPAAGEGGAAPSEGPRTFGSLLASSLGKLEATLEESTASARELATGQASDVASVVVDVERAALSLQLAVQIRNKAVEAYQELFRMQI